MTSELLSLSRQEMTELGYRIIDLLVEHQAGLRSKPVTRTASRAEMERTFKEPFAEAGQPIGEVLATLQNDVFSNIMHLDHPRFFAFVSGPGNFVSSVSEALMAGFNAFAGTWLEAAGPVQIELATIDWLRDLVDLPSSAGGLFLSGGSMANLTAMAVARNRRLEDRSAGAMIYCSDQTHSSIDRAVRILGFDLGALRKLPSDEQFKLSVEVLTKAISEDRSRGKIPFLVLANAGTTNTGAVDPLRPIAAICRQEELWLHVDGAYGAAAALSPRARGQLDGLESADSLTLDPHKWLFQPFEIGCLLMRDFRDLRATFHIVPEYLDDVEGDDDEINFCNYGIQLTRCFRALKLWTSLRVFGVAAFRQSIEKGIEARRIRTKAPGAAYGFRDRHIRAVGDHHLPTCDSGPEPGGDRRAHDRDRPPCDPDRFRDDQLDDAERAQGLASLHHQPTHFARRCSIDDRPDWRDRCCCRSEPRLTGSGRTATR